MEWHRITICVYIVVFLCIMIAPIWMCVNDIKTLLYENFINVNVNHNRQTNMQNKLESITYKITKNTKSTNCVICFEKIKKKQSCVKLHNNTYHKKCLTSWFKQSPNCPSCNTNFLNH